MLEIIAKNARWIDLYTEFVYIFSYLGQAFAISYVYHKSNGNIIPSIFVHFVNNFISLIMNLILMYSGIYNKNPYQFRYGFYFSFTISFNFY